MKKFLLITLTVLALAAVFWAAEGEASGTWGNLNWTLDDEGLLSITGEGRMAPFTCVDGECNDAWLSRRSSIKTVIIADGITSVDSHAFYGCSCLIEITIPASVTIIEEGTFDGFNNLTVYCYADTIAANGDALFIRGNAFINMRNINFVILDTADIIASGTWNLKIWTIDNEGLLTIRGFGIMESYTTCPWLRYMPIIQSAKISNGIYNVSTNAFCGCWNLKSVELPASVTSIGSDAFAFCSSLQSISIPESVTTIGSYAFIYSGLTGIVLPNSISFIGEEAFCNCHALSSIILPDSLTEIREAVFWNCSSLSSITIPANITSIQKRAFEGCTNLAEIHFDGYPPEMDSDAFADTTAKAYYPSHIPVWKSVISQNFVGITEWIPDSSLHQHVGFVADPAVEATCTSSGLTAEIRCSLCGEVLQAQQTVEALGHDWGNAQYTWADDNASMTAMHTCLRDSAHIEAETVSVTAVTVKAPTCTEPGQTTYTCTPFSNPAFSVQVKTVTDVSPLGHTPVLDPIVPPTDVHPGLTEGYHCSVCGEIIVPQSIIHPLVWETERSAAKVTIKKYYGSETNCSLPAMIDGLRVGAIDSGAFAYANCPERVYIPSGVDSISASAFAKEVTVYCYEYSEADYWAYEMNYPVVYVNDVTGGNFYLVTMPADFTMKTGDRCALGATVWPLLDANSVVVTSSDPDVVSADGQTLTGVNPGEAVITLKAGSVQASVRVTVHADPVDFAVVDTVSSESELYIITKTERQLAVVGLKPAGAELNLVWQSSNDGVAAVDQNGLVTAKRPGQAVITATAQNGLSRSCVVNVCYPAAEVVFSQSEYSVGLGGVLQTTALVGTIGGTYENRFVTFTSSDEAVLRVDAKTGVVRGVSLGTATLTAAADNGVSGTCTVTVREANTLVLPAGTTVIGSKAFAALSGVDVVVLPAGVSFIAPDTFSESNIVLSVAAGSYAESWAIEHGMPYTAR